MKQIFKMMCLMACVGAALSAAHAQASGKNLGLGVVLGSPTGITARYFLSRANSIDGAVGWSLMGGETVNLRADYLMHASNVLQVDRHPIHLFYGAGARFVSWENGRHHDNHSFALGARAPVGLNVFFQHSTIEAFGELALVMNLIPATSAGLDIGLGGRFYF